MLAFCSWRSNDLIEELAFPSVLAFARFDEPFVLRADASSVSVETVLSQRQKDEDINPVRVPSRTMNNTERNYTARERKALSVIFALRKFRTYLLSTKQLQLITDHQAFQYAFQTKDVNERVSGSLEISCD